MAELMQTDLEIMCDNCGRDCGDGYTERNHGVDSVTGYQDIEIVCSKCLAIEAADEDADETAREWMADTAYDCQMEDF